MSDLQVSDLQVSDLPVSDLPVSDFPFASVGFQVMDFKKDDLKHNWNSAHFMVEACGDRLFVVVSKPDLGPWMSKFKPVLLATGVLKLRDL